MNDHLGKKNKSPKLQQTKIPYKPKLSQRFFNPYSTTRLLPKKITVQQKTLQPIQTNLTEHWTTDDTWIGDRICELESYAARFWVQNTNGIDISSNFYKFMENIDYMGRYHIQFLSIPEAKINPYNHYIRDNLNTAHQWIYPEGHSNISNTRIDSSDIRQYGGVYSCTQGSLSSRFAGSGSDSLGRFNWIDFYGKTSHLRVYTLYRVNKGNDISSGDETAWMTQRIQLLEKNINEDPREHVVLTLCEKIKEDIKQTRSVIVCGDVNDDIFCSSFNTSMEKSGLHNIFSTRRNSFKKVRSCCNGSTIIDGVWMTLDVRDSLIRSGFSPFDFIFSSDHRGIYFDIDIRKLLDNTNHNLTPAPYRRLKSRVPTRVQKYKEIVFDMWENKHITSNIETIQNLLHTQGPTPANIARLNQIDEDIQHILSTGEKGCCKANRHCVDHWSPKLKESLRSLRHIKGLIRKCRKNKSNHKQLLHYIKERRLANERLRECKKMMLLFVKRYWIN